MEIELKARRVQDHDFPDFHIFAGEQRVGRIYRYHVTNPTETWWWGFNTICCDSTFEHQSKGYTKTFEEARSAFRVAFDHWLVWARAIKVWDLKRAMVDENLRKIGAV